VETGDPLANFPHLFLLLGCSHFSGLRGAGPVSRSSVFRCYGSTPSHFDASQSLRTPSGYAGNLPGGGGRPPSCPTDAPAGTDSGGGSGSRTRGPSLLH
jgi:hypothetical protein